MAKTPNRKLTQVINFRCDAAEHEILKLVMAKTGLSMSEIVREIVLAGIKPQLDEIEAAAGECPPGVDREQWLLQCGRKIAAVAEAARLRAKADALDAQAR